jgi:beta-1,2-mannobiose phosphorylase / 1,2-beta-oligomannan phosphorylase
MLKNVGIMFMQALIKNENVRDLATRFSENPLLTAADVSPTGKGMEVAGVFNPAVFTFERKTWLLARVAQRPEQREGEVIIPIINEYGELETRTFLKSDPKLDFSDPRMIRYDDTDYLTTHSHFKLMCSDDGRTFYEPENGKSIFAEGPLEGYGIEDCRVCEIANVYYLTYTMVSDYGVGVGMMQTRDWKRFDRKGMILPPHNKDCALFEEKIKDRYYALHSPSSPALGGNFLWLAESADTLHWGNHRCIATTRKDSWDSARIGAGCAPIQTPQGWLVIYHGVDHDNRYCLGGLLLGIHEPWRVIARSELPLMEPTASYELNGFFDNVIFSNGHLVVGDKLRLYYGAGDDVICGAELSIREILSSLTAIKI